MPRPCHDDEQYPDFTDTERSTVEQTVKQRYGKLKADHEAMRVGDAST